MVMADSTTVSEAQLTEFQEKAMELLANGGTLADLRGLGPQDIETIYSIGFNFYNQAKYEQAEPMFQFACVYSHLEPRYWMALGNCRQMMKNYKGAVDAYGFAFMLDNKDPWPTIQTAICYLAQGNKELAADSLTLADRSIRNGGGNETARQRIQALRQAL
jgi:type III secretion system low calcium response chaperone LcrH/SycD